MRFPRKEEGGLWVVFGAMWGNEGTVLYSPPPPLQKEDQASSSSSYLIYWPKGRPHIDFLKGFFYTKSYKAYEILYKIHKTTYEAL